MLAKLGGAILVERAERQGADWGAGYRRWAQLRGVPDPTIGMATTHAIPFSDELRGADRHAIAYTAASHRVIRPGFAAFMAARYPELTRDVPADSPDFLAGLLDTLSATVANREAMRYMYPHIVGQGILRIVDVPNPADPDNVGVNWH